MLMKMRGEVYPELLNWTILRKEFTTYLISSRGNFVFVYHVFRTPFTIQRICELLTEPRKHYTRPDKFLRGFEKVCLVVSTVDCHGKCARTFFSWLIFLSKIYNVDPRLCASIERSSTTMNGTSTECGSNSSVEDSSSGTKRSDEEEDDVDEDNTIPTESVTPPRRPCINFYRSLTNKVSTCIELVCSF